MQADRGVADLDRFESVAWRVVMALFLFFGANSLFAAPIKDMTNILGVRENQLIGYGLVVGLNGTGDGTTSTFTTQTLANLLQSVNIKVDQRDITSKNAAAVMVTAKLKPFARQGDRVDVQVSSIGDAKSLRGGTLLMTGLKGLDGNIYAVAQGGVSVGQGALANSGRILNGATVEQEVRFDLSGRERTVLSLKEDSLDNAVAIQNRINEHFKAKLALANDSRSISLKKPDDITMVELLSIVGNLEISPVRANKVTIDEKSGTIVAGLDIRVLPVVVTHGAITISVDSAMSPDGTPLSIANVAGALQQMGAGAADTIAILQALKKAGAIEAELEVIN
ncbi:MAG: flagellar basal body P-ring protein FlgI [Helicobacteraceae bacterium]|nr:flagellar basal body P-ring protein FlgI [Helicobacteraceae bacterium]